MTRDVITSTRATAGGRALRPALDDCQAAAPGAPRATHPDGEGGIPLDPMAVNCRPMPFLAYLALPRGLGRAEYVNGWTVVSPPPTVRRQRVCQRLSRVLQGSILSPAELVRRTGWQIRSGELVRVPDVMVLARAPKGCLVTDPPLIVVEVLDGGEEVDVVVKAGEYLHAGAEQLWVVDLTHRVVDVYAATGPGWANLAHLTARRPGATVAVTGLRPIELSVTEILG
jgi:Uma2 family endonuclease